MKFLDWFKKGKSEGTKLSDLIEDKDLKVAVESLEKDLAEKDAEIAALKAVNAVESEDKQSAKSLTEKDRTFTAKWEELNPKDHSKTIKKSGKFILLDVPKIRISGKPYSQEEFMKDKDAQSAAAAMGHTLIKKAE